MGNSGARHQQQQQARPPLSPSPRKEGGAVAAIRAPPPRPVSRLKAELPPRPSSSSSSSSSLAQRAMSGSVRLEAGKWMDGVFLNASHLGRAHGPLRCAACRQVLPPTKTEFVRCEECARVSAALFARLVRAPVPPPSRKSLGDAASGVGNEIRRVYVEDEWALDFVKSQGGEHLQWVRIMTTEEEAKINELYGSLQDLEEDELKARYEAVALKEGIAPEIVKQDLALASNREELIALLVVATAWGSSDFARAAFVRKFEKNGDLNWCSVIDFSLDPSPQGISASDIVNVCEAPFDDRVEWFRQQVLRLRIPAEEGQLSIRIRRDVLLEDASMCFMTVAPRELWRTCRYEFMGEDAMDSGGVAREFFTLVSNCLFDPGFGLFEPIESGNALAYRININSGIANELHLQYFRFAGRLLGKALIDGYNVNAHLTPDIYKHILSAPLSIRDLMLVDQQLARSAQQVMDCEDVEVLSLDFTTAVWKMGVTDTFELKPNGANIPVTNENREEYLKLLQEYIMFDRHHMQLSFFLRGFDEVIPSFLLTVFTSSELETLLCGRASIDVLDWMKHTVYRGQFKSSGVNHQVIGWFWELLKSMNYEELVKMLMFATGSERVPVQGFRALQGDDGTNMLFSIESITLEQSIFPRAHTCFNRLELPVYSTKEDLFKRVREVIEMAANAGFTME